MKTGIITIISRNYGNRLQNFALQRVLEKKNIKVRTVPINNYYSIKIFIKFIIKKVLWKNTVWEEFEFKIKYSYQSCKKININQYDFFIAGSDQIWNPYFHFNSEREFLYFAEDNQKLVYAASIGVERVSDKYCEKYSKLMNQIKYISVREESAALIVKKITGRDVPVVLDPVMLLEKEEWLNFVKRSRWACDKKYIFKYFLGGGNQEYDAYIEDIRKKGDYEVVDILGEKNKKYSCIGPKEFVSIISGADIVCTDSFHATVFSIIFSVPFITFGRTAEEGYGDMMPRLVSLLDKFELRERLIMNTRQLLLEDLLKCDFFKAQKILLSERKNSLQYLDEALGEKYE